MEIRDVLMSAGKNFRWPPSKPLNIKMFKAVDY